MLAPSQVRFHYVLCSGVSEQNNLSRIFRIVLGAYSHGNPTRLGSKLVMLGLSFAEDLGLVFLRKADVELSVAVKMHEL